MELSKAVELIMPACERFKGVTSWADLGCGSGLFTRALAAQLEKGSTVYAVDKKRSILDALVIPGAINLHKIVADFTQESLPLLQLDGLLMANSLHFVQAKGEFILTAAAWLKKTGCFLLVEYDTDTANPWVPYPLSFSSAEKLFLKAGFGTIKKLGGTVSLYHRGGMYAALVAR